MKFFSILVLALGALLFEGVPARAQFRSSPAFDPDCYEPQIGMPNQIDTIVGAGFTQKLGGPMRSIGVGTNGYNRIVVGGYPNNPNSIDMLTGSPVFNLHDLNPPKASFYYDGIRGHFHNSKLTDILVYTYPNYRIYWSDSEGNYDTTRFSVLGFKPFPGPINGPFEFNIFDPYIAEMATDSVDDVVLCYDVEFLGNLHSDSLYVVHYTGGQNLYSQGDTVLNDQAILFNISKPLAPYRNGIYGDFRGTGRADFIAHSSGNASDSGATLFYYRNVKPFNLDSFANAMLYDTFYTKWQNPGVECGGSGYWQMQAIRVFPKAKGDSSVDFLGFLKRTDEDQYYEDLSANFFRGGPDFGSQRITANDTTLCIRSPRYRDGSFAENFGGNAIACGDMTGTGNPVIELGGGDDNFFYVMGEAADDKVDMYYGQYDSPGFTDTITANGDGLEDIIGGNPNFSWNGGFTEMEGTVGIIYGSKQIPVHLNPKFASVKLSISDSATEITFSPNPIVQSYSLATILWPEAEEAEYAIYDMLGREMDRGTIRLLGGPEQQRIYFSNLPQGTYIYVITGSKHSASAKIVKLSPASSGGGSQPSIIQQMKAVRDGN